jgi:hypothetical protein
MQCPDCQDLTIRVLSEDAARNSDTNCTTRKRLPCVGFLSLADEEAFGFLDPNDVVRAAHLVPVYHWGHDEEDVPPLDSLAYRSDEELRGWNWFCLYVNMCVHYLQINVCALTTITVYSFVDRDMFSRFLPVSSGSSDDAAASTASSTSSDNSDSEDEAAEEDIPAEPPSDSVEISDEDPEESDKSVEESDNGDQSEEEEELSDSSEDDDNEQTEASEEGTSEDTGGNDSSEDAGIDDASENADEDDAIERTSEDDASEDADEDEASDADEGPN